MNIITLTLVSCTLNGTAQRERQEWEPAATEVWYIYLWELTDSSSSPLLMKPEWQHSIPPCCSARTQTHTHILLYLCRISDPLSTLLETQLEMLLQLMHRSTRTHRYRQHRNHICFHLIRRHSSIHNRVNVYTSERFNPHRAHPPPAASLANLSLSDLHTCDPVWIIVQNIQPCWLCFLTTDH